MARLLPLLLALAALLLFVLVRQQAARPRTDRTYRPRPSARPAAGASGKDDTQWVARRADIEGLRDAYTSAALDPAEPLFRCGGCQAYYHRTSLDALKRHNRGGCALCGSHDLRAVHVL